MAGEEENKVIWPSGVPEAKSVEDFDYFMTGKGNEPLTKIPKSRLAEVIGVVGESMLPIQGGATSAAAVALPDGPIGQNRWFDASWGYWKYNNVVLKNPNNVDGIPQGNDGMLYWNGTTEIWSISKVQALPQASADGNIAQGDLNAVNGDKAFKEFFGTQAVTEDVNYTKDLSTYATLVNNNFRYVNNVKTLSDKEILKSVSVKTPIGSVINVYAYKITGSNGSLVFEELHHFGSYTASTQITTINLTHEYEMPIGTLVAISSSLGIYYKNAGGLAGTYTTQASWTATELAHSFVTTKILTPAKEGVYPQLESQKTDIENVSDRVTELEENGTPALGKIEENDPKALSGDTAFKAFYGSDEVADNYSYPQDMSTFTSSSSNAARYINNVKTIHADEQLEFVTIKVPVGSVVNVYAYKITGSNGSLVAEELHHFGSFTTTVENETHNFSDSYKMPIGTYIGISSSKGVFYKNASLFATYPGQTTWANIALAHAFATKVVIAPSVAGVYTDINQLDVRVTSLEDGDVPTDHKFEGKRVSLDGDSLMEQGFVTSQVASIVGCTIINRAKSGSGYVMNMNGTIRSRADGVAAMQKDCIVIGSGGTNDWRNSKPLGSPDVIDDDTQFYSAVYNTFRVYREQNPTTPILVCTPTQGFYSNGSTINETRATKYNGRSFSEFVQVIRDVARIFSIQVCDLYDLSGITYENRGEYTSDGLHVNTAGGKLMAEKIAQALDTLVV